MSKLREARERLATCGIGDRSYKNGNGCYCSMGALQAAYSGSAYSYLDDLVRTLSDYDNNPFVEKRKRDFGEDVMRLHKVIMGSRDSYIHYGAARTDVEDWNDSVFDEEYAKEWRRAEEAGTTVDQEAYRSKAAERILAVWDKAIEELESRRAAE